MKKSFSFFTLFHTLGIYPSHVIHSEIHLSTYLVRTLLVKNIGWGKKQTNKHNFLGFFCFLITTKLYFCPTAVVKWDSPINLRLYKNWFSIFRKAFLLFLHGLYLWNLFGFHSGFLFVSFSTFSSYKYILFCFWSLMSNSLLHGDLGFCLLQTCVCEVQPYFYFLMI